MKKKNSSSESGVHKALFTVTPLSKYLAMALFIMLPLLAFYVGLTVQLNVMCR